MTQYTIGVDISKDTLDVHRFEGGASARFANDTSGLRALIAWIGVDAARVVFEPTGPYHRAFERALAKGGLPLVKVNPRQARRFAEATGRLAKTDRLDAAMLARMGALLELEVRPARSEVLDGLKDLHMAREALVKDRTAARNRAKTLALPLLKRQNVERLKQIAQQMTAIEAAILAIIRADPSLARRFDILVSIPGVSRLGRRRFAGGMPPANRPDGAQTGEFSNSTFGEFTLGTHTAWYRFSGDRKGQHPKDHLARFRGWMHADGYAGFEDLYRSGAIREVACMAHVRRKFVDIHRSQASPIAEEAIHRIAKLYAVEKEARGSPPDRRVEIRGAKAAPAFDDLEAWLVQQLPRISGKSPLAAAIRYALTRMARMRPYLTHGTLELDNNAAERAMRAIALGRKNYLFVGSEAGGKAAAIAYTLIETAKLNGVDPNAWLADALARIPDYKITKVDELLPWRWSR